jgi:hypothetical protein
MVWHGVVNVRQLLAESFPVGFTYSWVVADACETFSTPKMKVLHTKKIHRNKNTILYGAGLVFGGKNICKKKIRNTVISIVAYMCVFINRTECFFV